MSVSIKIVLVGFLCVLLSSHRIVTMHDSKKEALETTAYIQDDLNALFGFFITANEKGVEQIDFCIPYKFGISVEELFPEFHTLHRENKKIYIGKNIDVNKWLDLLCEKLDAETRKLKRAPLDIQSVREDIRLQKAKKKAHNKALAKRRNGLAKLSGIKKVTQKGS